MENDEGVLIGGFIVSGDVPKRVLIRGLGPSLASFGLTDLLEDPTLQLFGEGGQIAFNDDWRDLQESEIAATTIPPEDDREPAIIATLSPAAYTAIINGKNGVTGVGLLEVYDLNPGATSRLANISTRGSVQTQDNVMIGGFILGGSNLQPARVVVRAIGPSLTDAGVPNALPDPTLQLVNNDGQIVGFNDNWQDDSTQAAELQSLSLAPGVVQEAAIVVTLPPGPYTAIVAGQAGGTGVGLVEVYDVQ